MFFVSVHGRKSRGCVWCAVHAERRPYTQASMKASLLERAPAHLHVGWDSFAVVTLTLQALKGELQHRESARGKILSLHAP